MFSTPKDKADPGEPKLPSASESKPKVDERYGPIPAGFFNITDAAEYADLGQQRIRRLLIEGRIDGSKKEADTGRWLVSKAGLDTYATTKGTKRSGLSSFVIKVNTEEISPEAVLDVLQGAFGEEVCPSIEPRYKRKPKEE